MKELLGEYGLALLEMLAGVLVITIFTALFYDADAPFKTVVINYLGSIIR